MAIKKAQKESVTIEAEKVEPSTTSKTSKIPSFLSKMQREGKAIVAAELAKQTHPDIHLNPLIDWATGGIPERRVVILSGPPQSWKTGLALTCAAKIQQREKRWVIILDAEFNQDSVQASRLPLYGLDPEHTIIIPANQIDEVFSHLNDLEKDPDNSVCAVVVDSVSSLTSRWVEEKIAAGEIEAAGNGKQGGNAKLFGPLMMAYSRICAQKDASVFMISHAYEETDQWKKLKNPWIIAGGQKLRYLARSVIFCEKLNTKGSEIGQDGNVVDSKVGNVKVANMIRIKVVKTNRTVEGKAVDIPVDFVTCKCEPTTEHIFELAERLKVIRKEKEGGRVYLVGSRRCGSREDAINSLSEADVFKEVVDGIKRNPYGIMNGSSVDDSDLCKQEERDVRMAGEVETIDDGI